MNNKMNKMMKEETGTVEYLWVSEVSYYLVVMKIR